MAALDGGQIRIGSNYTIANGGPANHWVATNYGRIFKYAGVSLTVTFATTASFSSQFAAVANGEIFVPALNFTGTAGGPRYASIDNGAIRTASGNANYLPGSSAGVTANGGVYS